MSVSTAVAVLVGGGLAVWPVVRAWGGWSLRAGRGAGMVQSVAEGGVGVQAGGNVYVQGPAAEFLAPTVDAGVPQAWCSECGGLAPERAMGWTSSGEYRCAGCA